jgi:membrane-associated protease RseP (regulator of RpoE activity)
VIRRHYWTQLLFVLLCLMPLAVLFLLPSGGLLPSLLFWFLLMLSFLALWSILGRKASLAADAPEIKILSIEDVPLIVREIMNVALATEQGNVRIFRGRLRLSPSDAFAKLKNAFSPQAIPLLQQDDSFGAQILLMPRAVEKATMEHRTQPLVHWVLFLLTVLTTIWAGAAQQGVDLLREPERFSIGLPYALGILSILGVHEAGHYFMARRHGIQVTPPFFIPVPSSLGTFGAFIQMKSPTENRRALFDVAVAGPLAGLAIAIPALLIGLPSSSVTMEGAIPETGSPISGGATSVGSSLLLALIAKISIPEALKQGCVLQLSPIAFAGWLGLIITALNLLPIGQLDGGHMARAMFGQRIGMTISTLAMWSLLLLALFVWPGLLTFAILVFFLAGRSVPPLNDLVPISPGRRRLGYVTFLILALILVPLPHSLMSQAGIHCPYVGPPPR